ncbi:unnamed protein product, partial [marine sediment metagenome]
LSLVTIQLIIIITRINIAASKVMTTNVPNAI